jgi:ABC-type lipoprotein release transport system permease subunit
VVTNYADYSRTLVYLPTARADGEESAYCAVIGEEPNYSTIRIHLEKEDDKDTVLGIVQSYINNLGTMTVQMDHGSIKERITAAQNNRAMILILSSLVFAVSPLAGFFSQLLFYKKRHLEFDVLRAVGATKKDLRAMFTVDAAVMALLSALTYVIGTYLGIHLLCKLLNTPYVFMFMGETAASTFYPDIPLVPFFI